MERPYRTNDSCSTSAVLAEDSCAGIRVNKVLEIRRRLGEGTYNIEDRLDAVLEKILEDLS